MAESDPMENQQVPTAGSRPFDEHSSGHPTRDSNKRGCNIVIDIESEDLTFN